MARLLESKRCQNHLYYEGYIYRKNTRNKTTQSWRCVLQDCRGTACTPLDYTRQNVAVVTKQAHNHVPDPTQGAVREALMEMQNTSVVQKVVPPRRIISRTSALLNMETRSALPSYKAMVQRIRRRRRADEHQIPLPQSLETLLIPEEFRMIEIGGTRERFLLYDDHEEAKYAEKAVKRIIIFASDVMLDQLDAASTWMCDGTFKVVPKLFYQLYTIQALKGGVLLPCVYILMAAKNRETYERAFSVLKRRRPKLEPNVVILDFENAAMSAFSTVFRGVSSQACFFHLAQNIWRKIQCLGLTSDYIHDERYRYHCKILSALAFLKPGDVLDAFDQINEKREKLGLNEKVGELYLYFEEFYLGKRGENGERRVPAFPVEIWNVRARTELCLPRTNNMIEAWHKAIQGMYDASHPNLWRFLKGIQNEEAMQRLRIQELIDGKSIKKGLSRYENTNGRLNILISSHEIGVISDEEFLLGVMNNIHLSV